MVITLKDIAERAGVSTTTVSRILNGRDSGLPIRDDTRQRVLTIAAELGYRPNLMARALRGSPSSLLGVLAQNITSLFHSQILRGLNEAAVSRAYRVFLGHVQRQVNIAVDYSSMFEQSHADGILVVGEMEGNQDALDVLARHHRHVVTISNRTSDGKFPGVYADSEAGTQLALDHLWGLGHRRILCVADPKIRDGVLRADAFQRFMQARDAAADKSAVILTTRTFQESAATGQAIFADFARPDRPTAIFAATDGIAIGLMQAAFQAGIAIPRELSIVGYDDIDVAAFTIPPLTTVRQDGFEMGRIAANLLMDLVEQQRDGSEVDDTVLVPTLVVRQSTSAPAI